MQIEQAIFTSAITDRAAGYHLVSRSPGISEADARDLAAWGPSHDSLLAADAWPTLAEVCSVNFFPLTSGAYCVSRTSVAGSEYSERGGAQVYTQCLVVPADLLLRFANNPFALLRAAEAAGALAVHENIPPLLSTLQLGGRTAVVDRALLGRLAGELDASAIAKLVEAALAHPHLSVVGGSAENAFAALVNCLPIECRTAFSFSTGLKHSARRPFRLVGLGEDRAAARQLARHNSIESLDLAELRTAGNPAPVTGWAGFVAAALTRGKLQLLSAEFSNNLRSHTLEDLDATGDELLEQLGASDPRPIEHVAVADSGTEESAQRGDSANVQRADAPHRRFESQPQQSDEPHNALSASGPIDNDSPHGQTASENLVANKKLLSQSPEVLEMLEHLDDVVFAAIEGKAIALEQVEVVWALVLDELGPELVEESREQYLRYALQVWNQCLAGELTDPARAVAAVDVMCMLFGD